MWYNNYWGNIDLNISKLSQKKLKQYESNLEFQNIFNHFFNAALNDFKYGNLPETMDERFIERSFLLAGRCLAAEKGGALLSLAPAPGCGITLYGYPARAFGWGLNGYNEEFSLFVPGADESLIIKRNAGGEIAKGEPNAVMGYDNSTAYPYVNYLITECLRLANLKMAIDVLVENLKSPLIISCDDTAVNSVKEALKQKSDNLPQIVGTGKMPVDAFHVWDTKASPETLKSFRELYEWYENRLRVIFGINSNDQIDKKERLLVDEINANDQITADSVDKRLTWRKRWVDQINSLWGTNITVSLRNPPAINYAAGSEEGPENVDE